MKEVFLIEKGSGDRLSVAVDGRMAEVTSTIDEAVLKFRFDDTDTDTDTCTEYTIDWEERPLRMTLQDVLGDGEINNSEWGWVVPATEDFKCH